LIARDTDEPARLPEQEAYTLKSLDQVKVLADPLRIRILEAFCQERTTKQVADLIGEKPTKLYHHVDALVRVGLIEQTRTRRNRGTLERYYLAVARTFRAYSGVFGMQASEGGEKSTELGPLLSSFFDTTSDELATLLKSGGEDATDALEKEGIVSFLEVRGSKAELNAIRDKLLELVESLTGVGESDDEKDQERYRMTLAFYPLDANKNRGKVRTPR
jgi:DNA-binding transcriptional ArsR family regulator